MTKICRRPATAKSPALIFQWRRTACDWKACASAYPTGTTLPTPAPGTAVTRDRRPPRVTITALTAANQARPRRLPPRPLATAGKLGVFLARFWRVAVRVRLLGRGIHPIAEKLTGRCGFLYTNSHPNARSVSNALTLKRLVGQSGGEVRIPVSSWQPTRRALSPKWRAPLVNEADSRLRALKSPRPVELLWTVHVDGRFYHGELRDHGPRYGVEFVLRRDADLRFARRFPTRAEALREGEEQRCLLLRSGAATREP